MGSDWSVAEFSLGLGEEHSPPPLSCAGLPLVTRSGHVQWVQTAGPGRWSEALEISDRGFEYHLRGSEGLTC